MIEAPVHARGDARPVGVLVAETRTCAMLFPPEVREGLRDLVLLPEGHVEASDFRRRVADFGRTEVLLTGWGAPRVDGELLRALPLLRAVFHGGGSLRGIATEEAYARGVRFFSSLEPTNRPVAEYTFAQVVLALKRVWPQALRMRNDRSWVREVRDLPGTCGSAVGLVSFGRIGRDVREWLRRLEVRVLVTDPALTAEDAERAGVERVGLDGLFAQCDVVSCHAPWLPATERMIGGRHFAAMKPGATFINTARGAVVAEDEMIRVLGERPDLTAILDVTWPEPPVPGSPLFTLPNVMLTPHLAGCVGRECRRNGALVLECLQAWRAGRPVAAEQGIDDWRRMGRSR